MNPQLVNGRYHWDRSCHKHPTPETDHIDAMLNEMESRTVRLSAEQSRKCAAVGRAMDQASIAKGSKSQRVKRGQTDEYINVAGQRGECASCDLLGLVYRGRINQYRNADLPHNIEVRTRMNFKYELKIRPDDDDSRRMVLVLTQSIDSPLVIVGWILAAEGKKIGRLIDPHGEKKPFHAVPQEQLRSIWELKALVDEEKKRHP